MTLSRTGLKELSKRYKNILLKCFWLNAFVCGLLLVPFGAVNGAVIDSDTMSATDVYDTLETQGVSFKDSVYINVHDNASFTHTALKNSEGQFLPVNLGKFTVIKDSNPQTNASLTFINGLYELTSYIAGGSSQDKIHFENATIKVFDQGDRYTGITYSFDENTILDLRDPESQGKQVIEFENMAGEGALIGFYITNTGSDRLISQKNKYEFNFDPLLISLASNVEKDKLYRVQPLGGLAEFKDSFATNGVYTAQTSQEASIFKVVRNDENDATSLLQTIEFTYKGKTNENTLASFNQYEGDGLFYHDINESYKVSGDLGETGFGEKTIKGLAPSNSSSPLISKIEATDANGNGVSLFNLKQDTTDQGRTASLLLKDLTIEGAELVLTSEKESGLVVLNNVQILGQNSGLIENGALLNVENSILKNVTNTGTATLTDTQVQGDLRVEEGALSFVATQPNKVIEVQGKTTVSSLLNVSGQGAVTLNGVSGNGVIQNTAKLNIVSETNNYSLMKKGIEEALHIENKGELNLQGVTLFDITQEETGSLSLKGNNTLIGKESKILGSVQNEGELVVGAQHNLSLGSSLSGNGTLIMNEGAVLDGLAEFETTNNLISLGMTFGHNIKHLKAGNLTVEKNTLLDIKNIDVTVKEIVLAENSTLKVSLNGLNDYGSITATKLDSQTGATIKFDYGKDFTAGVYQIFKVENIASLPQILNLNNDYILTDLKNGSYSFTLKEQDNLIHFISNENNKRAVGAIQKGQGTNDSFNAMQKELSDLLRSDNPKAVQKGIKATEAVGANFSSTVQSVAVEQIGALVNAIGLNIQSESNVSGRSGGGNSPRASVWTKALYSKTKDSSHGSYKIHGTGGILGLQTKATKDLTLGVGYAYNFADVKQTGRDTTVHNNTAFGYLKYQPCKWFVDGILSYTRGQYEEEKYILSSSGKAKYQVDVLAVQSLIGYDYSYKGVLLTPKSGLRYMKINQEGYMDSFGTTVDPVSSDYLTFMLGGDFYMPYRTVKGFSVRPTGSVLFGYDLKTDDVKGVNTLSNGSSYVVQGDALPRFSTNVKLGLEVELNEKTTFHLEYFGSYRKSYQDHGGVLKLRYNF